MLNLDGESYHFKEIGGDSGWRIGVLEVGLGGVAVGGVVDGDVFSIAMHVELVRGCDSVMCKSPYQIRDGEYVGCGQCMHCRINKAREWQHRIMLELRCHAASSFVTLTYADECLPEGGNLRYSDFQKFLKRLRRLYRPIKLRYFVVGEYGERSMRPHYHACIFGLDRCHESMVKCTWWYGNVDVGEVNEFSARYVTNYVTKGWTKKAGDSGLVPEFARMSLKPGIGADAVKEIGEKVASSGWHDGGVVKSLRYGKKQFPLGRYLTDKVCGYAGVDELRKDKEFAAVCEERKIKAKEEGLAVYSSLYKDKEQERYVQLRKRQVLRKGRPL